METRITHRDTDADSGDLLRDDIGGETRSSLPESVAAIAEDRVSDPGVEELDATSWLLEADGPTADEVEPTTVRLNVGGRDKPKWIEWKVVPLPDEEFRKFRKAALGGNRSARRSGMGGNPLTDMDDAKYHLLVVTAATVEPNLREIARQKSVNDPAEVVRHRFAHKPGLISQVSGVVSDISGFDESDLEVIAGKS